MKIGNLILPGKVILAPLAGIADFPFRFTAKRFGAALVYTEMISAEGILRGNISTLKRLHIKPEERPIGVQIFGSDPEKMASACQLIRNLKPELVDLNFGCPVKKVVTKSGGAALLKDLVLLQRIVSAVVESAAIPVTVKIRSGWDHDNLVAVQVARIAEECGTSAITVHPRTQKDGFSNKADWNIIAQVKKEVKIPVIGSGDVFSPQDAKNMFESTGCDAVMIGRGALGNPWIFSRTIHFLKYGELLPEPSFDEKIRICLEQAELSVKEKGEARGMRTMRKHLVWYTKGMPKSKELRQRLFCLETLDEAKRILFEYLLWFKQKLQSTPREKP
jgi:tRNA-dihydrouridine synthase B